MKTNISLKYFVLMIAIGIITLSFFLTGCGPRPQEEKTSGTDTSGGWNEKKLASLFENDEWVAPDTSTLPHDKYGDLVRYGRDLVANTSSYFGPGGKINHFAN